MGQNIESEVRIKEITFKTTYDYQKSERSVSFENKNRLIDAAFFGLKLFCKEMTLDLYIFKALFSSYKI